MDIAKSTDDATQTAIQLEPTSTPTMDDSDYDDGYDDDDGYYWRNGGYND